MMFSGWSRFSRMARKRAGSTAGRRVWRETRGSGALPCGVACWARGNAGPAWGTASGTGAGCCPRALAMRACAARRLAVGSTPAGTARGGAAKGGCLGSPASDLCVLGMVVSAVPGEPDPVVLGGWRERRPSILRGGKMKMKSGVLGRCGSSWPKEKQAKGRACGRDESEAGGRERLVAERKSSWRRKKKRWLSSVPQRARWGGKESAGKALPLIEAWTCVLPWPGYPATSRGRPKRLPVPGWPQGR